MKKKQMVLIAAIIVCLVVVTFIVYFTRREPANQVTLRTEFESYDINDLKIRVYWENNGRSAVTVGTYFSVEKMDGYGEEVIWVFFGQTILWEDDIYVIPRGGTLEMVYDFENATTDFRIRQPGLYRLRSYYHFTNNRVTTRHFVYAEFVVTE